MISRILNLIEKNNITANKLTTDLNLPMSAISEWKKGKARPSVDAILKISQYFNVSTDYIIKGNETVITTQKETLYSKLEKLCIKYQIPIGDIYNESEDVEILLCLYPRADVFYRVFARAEKVCGSSAAINLFNELYGEGSNINFHKRLSSFINENAINIQPFLIELNKCETFNTLVSESTLRKILANSNCTPEYILYGRESDAPNISHVITQFAQLNEKNLLVIAKQIDSLLKEQSSALINEENTLLVAARKNKEGLSIQESPLEP